MGTDIIPAFQIRKLVYQLILGPSEGKGLEQAQKGQALLSAFTAYSPKSLFHLLPPFL